MSEQEPVPHRARKRFGQHFLVDPTVVDAILAAAAAGPGTRILEIGPGGGVLTGALVAAGAQVLAIEIDRDLAAALATRFAGQDRFALHIGDVLDFDFAALPAGPPWRVVGNLPYNISTPLLMRLLEHAAHFETLLLMVQKEVAERLVAVPGSAAYGRLGIMAQRRARIEWLFEVGPTSFAPPPRVDSAVVRVAPRPGPFDPHLEGALAEVVRVAFSARRKTLANALRGQLERADLVACGIDPGARPETLDVADYVGLADRLLARRANG